MDLMVIVILEHLNILHASLCIFHFKVVVRLVDFIAGTMLQIPSVMMLVIWLIVFLGDIDL